MFNHVLHIHLHQVEQNDIFTVHSPKGQGPIRLPKSLLSVSDSSSFSFEFPLQMACGLFSFCTSQKSCDGDRRLIPSMSTCFYCQDLHLKKCSTNKKCKRHSQCPIR